MSSDRSPRVKLWVCPSCKKALKNVRLPVHHSCTPQGLGDSVAELIRATTNLTPCAGCNERKAFLNWLIPYPTKVNSAVRYVTLCDLSRDSVTLAENIPSKTVVVGCARSGMLPASIVATLNHCELWSLDVERKELVPCGNGIRFSGEVVDRTRITIVDDSMWSGHAMRRAVEVVSSRFPRARVSTAVLYGQPHTYTQTDLCIEVLPAHVFEWNIFNSPVAEVNAYDIDGILSPEVPAEVDDDGRKYRQWLESTSPTHYRPLRHPLTLITARLEKYRDITMAWMEKHGYRVERLVMGPWASNLERSRSDVGAWKASVYSEMRNKQLFIESCPLQSETIYTKARKNVLCPPAGRVWYR